LREVALGRGNQRFLVVGADVHAFAFAGDPTNLTGSLTVLKGRAGGQKPPIEQQAVPPMG
jgi:hypothetical protein